MLETCKSCGTVFEVDESVLTKNIQWLKCGVCNNKWVLSSNLDKNLQPKNSEVKEKSEILQQELASIKSVVEDKSKILLKKTNPVLDQKNKSVAEIASELSLSKVKETNKNNHNKSTNVKGKKKSKKLNIFPIFILFLGMIFSLGILFRSLLISYSYLYFPNYSQNHAKNIKNLFSKINLPILSETKYLNLTNFIATFEKQEVRFTGVIKNNSKMPILTPRIKILGIREDRKIIFEKILILEEKIILPNSEIRLNKLVKLDINIDNKENISIKATLLNKFFD